MGSGTSTGPKYNANQTAIATAEAAAANVQLYPIPTTHSAWAVTNSQKIVSDVAALSPNHAIPCNDESLETIMVVVYQHGNAFSAVQKLLDNVNARNYFRKYLKSEFAAEGLLFYEEAELFKRAPDMHMAVNIAKSLRSNYLLSGSDNEVNISDHMKSTLAQLLNSFADNPAAEGSLRVEIDQHLETALREVIAILAMNGFSRFVESNEFKTWRLDENMKIKALSHSHVEEHIANRKDTSNRSNNGAQSVLVSALQCIEPLELKLLFDLSSLNEGGSVSNTARNGPNRMWLRQFIAIAELLPISITIATARQSRRGYPIIYANPEFCALSGYSHDELIGHNLKKFVQKQNKTERDAVSNISVALANHQRVCADITNFSKDGQFYRVLLALHPLFEASIDSARRGATATESEPDSSEQTNDAMTHTCAYYIGIQHDITGEGASSKVLKFAELLLSKLPLVLA